MKNLRSIFLHRRFQFWGVFILLVTLRFLPFLLGKTLVFGDNYSLHMPGKIFAAEWLGKGVLPLWNPYIFSGLSTQMMDVNQSVLNPSTLLFVVFPPAVALNLTVIFSLLIAYAGMYLLAKVWLKDHGWALVAAVLWMFSTQVTGSANNLATLQSVIWLPMIAYMGLRLVKEPPARLWLALVILIQFLSGYPQHVLYGILLAVGLSAFFHWRQVSLKQWFSAWFIAGILTAGVSAVTWLPFLEALQQSTRTLQTEAQALVGSLHPAMIIKFVLPYFFDDPAVGVKWGPAWSGQPNVGIYLSWVGWLAAGSTFFLRKKSLRREVWFFAAVTAFTLIFSLGEYLPGFHFIQKAIPFFRIARYPSMMMIISNVVLALWAARGLQQWPLSSLTTRRLRFVAEGTLVIGIAGWWLVHHGFENVWHTADRFVSFSLSESPFHTIERDKIILLEISKNIVFNSIFFFASLWIIRTVKGKILPLLLALMIGADLLYNTHGQFFFAPNAIYDTASPNSTALRQQLALPATGFQYRLLTRNFNRPYTDFGSYWEALVVRAPFSDSFVDERELREFSHVQALRDGFTPNWNSALGIPAVNGYTTLLPTEYASWWNRSAAEPRINFVEEMDPADPLLDEWAVKYYLVDRWFTVKEDVSAFPVAAEFDRWQLLERPDALPRLRYEDGSEAFLIEFTETPNSMRVVVQNNGHQGLIIADRYDPDWRARLDGQLVPIENRNGMRYLPLKPYINTIILEYRPRALILGAKITLWTIIGAAASLFWMKYRQKGRKRNTDARTGREG